MPTSISPASGTGLGTSNVVVQITKAPTGGNSSTFTGQTFQTTISPLIELMLDLGAAAADTTISVPTIARGIYTEVPSGTTDVVTLHDKVAADTIIRKFRYGDLWLFDVAPSAFQTANTLYMKGAVAISGVKVIIF